MRQTWLNCFLFVVGVRYHSGPAVNVSYVCVVTIPPACYPCCESARWMGWSPLFQTPRLTLTFPVCPLVGKIGERLCDKLEAGAAREEVVTAKEIFCEGSR